MQDGEQRHIDEKAQLYEKLEETRRQVQEFLPMQDELRRAQREKEEMQAQLEAAGPKYEEEIETLQLENERMVVQMTLQMEDSEKAGRKRETLPTEILLEDTDGLPLLRGATQSISALSMR